MLRPEPKYPDAKSHTSFQDGLEFQDFVCERLAKHGIVLQNLSSKKWQLSVGENLQGFEIKLDNRCTDTGRLSIEIEEKSRQSTSLLWTPSGILRDDNSWLYIQGNHRVLFIFAKRFLLRWYHHHEARGTLNMHEAYGTVRAFYLPLDQAAEYAAKVLDFDNVLGKQPGAS